MTFKSIHIFVKCCCLLAGAVIMQNCSQEPKDNRVDTTANNNVTEQINPHHKAISVLKDSVASLQRQDSVLSCDIEQVAMRFSSLMSDFKIINDPLLVEPYRVLSGWEKHDTYSKPGIMARVLEDSSIEVIVTAAADFSSIILSCQDESVNSATVPAGNALHKTIGAYTRVAFNNDERLAQFVAEHVNETVRLRCNSGQEFELSQAQKQMMADNYNFASTQRHLTELDRQKTVISNKLHYYEQKLQEYAQ